jgi:Zincin-like metallopeptidase
MATTAWQSGRKVYQKCSQRPKQAASTGARLPVIAIVMGTPDFARFGSGAYAAEELVAEIGAAFLCAEFGFDGNMRHAGYLAIWIDLLKSDKRGLVHRM